MNGSCLCLPSVDDHFFGAQKPRIQWDQFDLLATRSDQSRCQWLLDPFRTTGQIFRAISECLTLERIAKVGVVMAKPSFPAVLQAITAVSIAAFSVLPPTIQHARNDCDHTKNKGSCYNCKRRFAPGMRRTHQD